MRTLLLDYNKIIRTFQSNWELALIVSTIITNCKLIIEVGSFWTSQQFKWIFTCSTFNKLVTSERVRKDSGFTELTERSGDSIDLESLEPVKGTTDWIRIVSALDCRWAGLFDWNKKNRIYYRFISESKVV